MQLLSVRFHVILVFLFLLVISQSARVFSAPDPALLLEDAHYLKPSYTYISPNYHQLTSEEKQDIVTILVVDGGGVFGIMPAQILEKLENDTSKPSSSLFDIMAGTSTGSIVTTSLSVPNKMGTPAYSASDLVQLYINDSGSIFHASLAYNLYSLWGLIHPKFKNNNFLNYLDKRYGNLTLSQLMTTVIVPCGLMLKESPYWFNSLSAKRHPADDFFVKDVVAAATATPSLFKPYLIFNKNKTRFNYAIDGAMIANNPTLQAYFYAKTNFPHKKYVIVSLGTGSYQESKDASQPSIFENLGLINGLLPTFSLSFTLQAQQTDQQMRRAAVTQPEFIMAYYRFNIRLNPKDFNSSSFYDGSASNIENIQNTGEKMLKTNKQSLKGLATILNEIKKNN